MSADRDLRWRAFSLARLPANILRKRGLLHPAMYSRLFKCFERRRLRVRQPWFCPTLGKSPASATRLHQKKFNAVTAHPITNGSHLFAPAQLAKMRQPKDLRG
jgi:hypothetical protein